MYEGFKQLLSFFKRGGVFGGWGVGVGDWVGVSDRGRGFREICSFLTCKLKLKKNITHLFKKTTNHT